MKCKRMYVCTFTIITFRCNNVAVSSPDARSKGMSLISSSVVRAVKSVLGSPFVISKLVTVSAETNVFVTTYG